MSPSTMPPDDLHAIANAVVDESERRSTSGVHKLTEVQLAAIAANEDDPAKRPLAKHRWWDRYNVAFSVMITASGILLTVGLMWGAFGSTVQAQAARITAVEQSAKEQASANQKAAVAQAELKASNTVEHQAMTATAAETKVTTTKIAEKVSKIELDVALVKQTVDAQSKKLDQLLARTR